MPDKSVFYNVMSEASVDKAPQRKVNSAVANQVFTTGPSEAKVSIQNSPGRFSKLLTRKAVLIPLIVLVLGAIGFGVYSFTKSKSPAVPENISPTHTETVTDPDVTTPADWLARYFGSETCTIKTQCGDSADPDRDGLTNKEESDLGTDPNNPDSDSDGISDGDEHHIFNSDPLLSRTFRGGEYNDADFVKGSYDISTNTPYTQEQLLALKAKVKELGLHQPTLTTIGSLALTIYDFTDPNAPDLSKLNIDQSPQAKLDRDTQRQSTIKKIGGALLKYKESKKSFPLGSDFVNMSDEIGSFNTVATNYNDPINKEQYVYGYSASATGGDFTLTYYSETQNQLIKYTAKNAEDNNAKETAQINNDKRITDLENIKNALMIYSTATSDSNSTQLYVFPTKDQYPYALIPRYLTEMPKDPKGTDYVYEVSPTYDTFTLKSVFESPPAGMTGYMCNQDGCQNY